MVFSRRDQHFEDLSNLLKVLIKFTPPIPVFFKDLLTYIVFTFMLKLGKQSYTPMREKCYTIINLQLPKLVKDCISFCGMVKFLPSFLQDLRKHLTLSIRY